MTAKQLTDSILQLAIQGKLVPQDPNDEPASILLERIREEKRRLVEEKVLKKKDLEETPIDEDEIPFNIPENWVWCRLKSIFSMQAGKNVTSVNINDVQSEEFPYPCFGGNGLRGFVKSYNTEGEYPLIGRQGALCGNVNMARGKFWATEHAVVTNGFKMTDTKWQYYFLRGLNLNKYATATAQPGLAVSKIIETLIPLPPLEEQKRIAKKMEEFTPIISELIEAYEEASKMDVELPDKLKKSILQEAIKGKLDTQDSSDEPASILLEHIREEKKRLVKEGMLKKKDLEETPIDENEIPFKIPDSWVWVRINSIAISQLGKTLDRGKQTGKEYPYLCSINVYWDGIDLSKVKTFLLKDEELSRYRLSKGDLLVCEGGDYGRCSVWDREEEMYYQNALHRIRFFGKISPYYFKYVFEIFKYTGYIVGQGQTIKHFTYDNMKSILYPLPPLAEQHRIVKRIEELFAEIENMTINNDINETEE